MSIWIVLLGIFHVFLCLLLTVIVLVQQGRGGGLVGMLSGGSGDALFAAGSRNPLRKVTTVIAILFFLSCIFLIRIFRAGPVQGANERAPVEKPKT